MAESVHAEFVQQGLPFQAAIDHLMRAGHRRQTVIRVIRKAYKLSYDPPTAHFVPGGRVSPR